MVYLVTGCDGYFGSALIFTLERHQIKTIGLARNTSVFESVKFSYVSFQDYTFLEDFGDNNITIIVHCAGLSSTHLSDYSAYYDANVKLTERVARFARNNNVSHFFFLSSVKIYGSNYFSDLFVNRVSVETMYAKSKLEAERILEKYECSFFVHILRIPNIVLAPSIELKSYNLLIMDLCYQIVNYGSIKLKSNLNTIVTILPGSIVLSYLINESKQSMDIKGYEVVDFCDAISMSLADVKILVENSFQNQSLLNIRLNTKQYSIEQFQFNNTHKSKLMAEFKEEEVIAMITGEVNGTLNFFNSII